MKVAYLVSRFPSTTETFIAREMRAVEELGAEVELFSLIRQRGVVVHAEASPFLARLRTAPLTSGATWAAQWFWLRRSPRAYLKTLWSVTRGNLRSLGFVARAWIVFPMAARFAREVRATGVQHVHAHWATHPALAAYVVHHLTGVPYSFTAHAHDLFVDRTMLQEKIDDARFVAVISDYNRELLRRLYGERAASKTVVVRCGVDTAQFIPRRRVRTNGGEPLIVCIASLQPYKGHIVLVDALADLERRGVAFRCVLVGDGEMRGQIERRVEQKRVAARVELLGARSSDEVLLLLQEADVAVLPSVVARDGQMEGIPVALMEALACEIPVVASRLSGIPELVRDGENGLLVEPGDVEGLGRAIERLLRDPDSRRRLGAAGRGRVVDAFNDRENAARLLAAFSTRPDARDEARVRTSSQSA